MFKRLTLLTICITLILSPLSVSASSEEYSCVQDQEIMTVNMTVDPNASFENTVKLIEQTDGVNILSENSLLTRSITVCTTKENINKISRLNGISGVYESSKINRPRAVGDIEPAVSGGFERHFADKQAAGDDIDYLINKQSGGGQVVAIIDTGINPYHETMSLDEGTETAISETEAKEKIEQLGYGRYFSEKIPFYFNYHDRDYNITDKDNKSHGMMVASLAAGNSEKMRSAAANAQILAMRVFSDNDEYASDYDVVTAMEDALFLGADVINLSLGGDGGFSNFNNFYSTAIKKAQEMGVVIVSAAGNSGTSDLGNPDSRLYDNGTVSYPASQDGVISVAACDLKKEIAYFSGYGPLSDLSFGVDITAKGVDTFSASNSGYSIASGTSFASPTVAAAAVLVRAKLEAQGFSGKELCETTASVIKSTATPTDETVRAQGSGILNLKKALKTDVCLMGNGKKNNVVLGEMDSMKTFSIELKNLTERYLDYSVDDVSLFAETKTASGKIDYATVNFNKSMIELLPKATESISINFTLPSRMYNDSYIYGFIKLSRSDGFYVTIPFLGFNGKWTSQPVITGGDEYGDLCLYTRRDDVWYENNKITPNADGIDDFIYPVFFQYRDAKYIKSSIYSKDVEFICDCGYLGYSPKDKYYDYAYEGCPELTDKYDATRTSSLACNGYYYNAKTGDIEPLPSGEYYLVIEAQLDFENASSERQFLKFFVDSTDAKIGEEEYDIDSDNSDIQFVNLQNVTYISDYYEGFDKETGVFTDIGSLSFLPDKLTVEGKEITDFTEKDGRYYFEASFLLTDSLKAYNVVAEKNSERVIDKEYFIGYDDEVPLLKTDIKYSEIPSWLCERLNDYKGIIFRNDLKNGFNVKASDNSFYYMYLCVNSVVYLISDGTDFYDIKVNINNFLNGDILLVEAFDCSGFCTQEKYFVLDFLPVFGDNDFDEKVTSADALRALQASVGKYKMGVLEKAVSDMDGNNSISASDALKILQISVGKITIE